MSKFSFRAWPTQEKVITQKFGARPWAYAEYGLPGHEGIDFAASVGSPVLCVAAGEVEAVFQDNGVHPYGANVRVRHRDGFQTIYAHLHETSVNAGERVRAGQTIGLAGKTGNVTGPHLHLTLKQDGATLEGYPNNIIDPTPFVDALLDPNWLDATFVRDLVPDGTVFAANQPFTQTWFLRNSGNRAWDAGCTLSNLNGVTLGAPVSVPLPAIPPSAEASVTVPMAAARHGWSTCKCLAAV